MDNLDLNTINTLIGVASPEIKKEVANKIEETVSKLEQQLGRSLIRPTKIEYDLKGHTAGEAWGAHKIRLNLALLNDPRYHDRMINQTLPHEVAHCVVSQLHPLAKPHGYEWQVMMVRLGLPPDRCHQYETQSARKRNTRKYFYNCDCESGHAVSITIHRRITQGRKYKCRECGGILR